MFGVDVDNDDGKELLQMIVKLYITTQGVFFSFASSCIELFKDLPRTLQKRERNPERNIYF